MALKTAFCLLLFIILVTGTDGFAATRWTPEREALKQIKNRGNNFPAFDGRCTSTSDSGYSVYLIDNFDQKVATVPELDTSHGELVKKILTSGRDDIRIRQFNTSLVRGLAQVVLALYSGRCVDAVISAVPGSNYAYGQLSSVLDTDVEITPDNILNYKPLLHEQIIEIALSGFPSLNWLKKLDANPIKLREDAYKVALIEELNKHAIPVYLPYGNRDALYRGEKREINLLALAEGVHIYSGIDVTGQRLSDFPHSPLSSGAEVASFRLLECPHPGDGRVAELDINEDGVFDYTYFREDFIAYYDETGVLSYAPPPVSNELFDSLLNQLEKGRCLTGEQGIVLSVEQYEVLADYCGDCNCPVKQKLDTDNSLIWIYPGGEDELITFNPECRLRGYLRGSSFIPPVKLKMDLPYHREGDYSRMQGDSG